MRVLTDYPKSVQNMVTDLTTKINNGAKFNNRFYHDKYGDFHIYISNEKYIICNSGDLGYIKDLEKLFISLLNNYTKPKLKNKKKKSADWKPIDKSLLDNNDFVYLDTYVDGVFKKVVFFIKDHFEVVEYVGNNQIGSTYYDINFKVGNHDTSMPLVPYDLIQTKYNENIIEDRWSLIFNNDKTILEKYENIILSKILESV